jgi:hypothetical protein
VSLLRTVGITEAARLTENPEPDARRQFQVAFILARKAPADGDPGQHPAATAQLDLIPVRLQGLVPGGSELHQGRTPLSSNS